MNPRQPDPNQGIRTAGTVAIWVWVVLTLLPIVVIGLCVLGCFAAGIIGAATSDPSVTP